MYLNNDHDIDALEEKTEDELRRERVDAILDRNAPISTCIVCNLWIYKAQPSTKTIHGDYHEACLEGRDVDDPNHY